MPAVNPRRECPCSSHPLLTGRSEEEPFGAGPFVGLAAIAAILGLVHFFVLDWGWIAWFLMAALELMWIVSLWFCIGEVRAQRRAGLVYLRLDTESSRLGGELRLRMGPGRSLAGLQGIEVGLRCIDAFMEEREVEGEDGPTKETMRICYVVWDDSREIGAAELLPRGEASFQFTLPLAGDFAGPWGTWVERYWEIEVMRHGGASGPRFRVLVYP